VYDALQLSPTCNIPFNSGKTYTPGPLRYNTVPSDTSVEIYVDPEIGSDENPGTSSQPVKSINIAVQLMRLKRARLGGDVSGIIYLMPGRYQPKKPINLTPDDSNLAIIGSGVDSTIISGAKEYTLKWEQYTSKNASLEKGVSIVNDTLIGPGMNASHAKFIPLMVNASECRKACNMDPSCFAYTFFDSSSENYSNMCYFRTDGLWAPVEDSTAMSGRKLNIMVADLSGQNPTTFTSLFLNGHRATRARYPNSNPETMGLHTYPTGYMSSAVKWLPPKEMPPAEEVNIATPKISRVFYGYYNIGIGGPVEAFDPPKSYWGLTDPAQRNDVLVYKVPTGLEYSPSEEFSTRMWKNPTTGVVHAYHGIHWGNWQFKIDDCNYVDRTISWSYGGFQEARGYKSGSEWFIDNIFEELDAPGEWFYDEKEQKLYFYPNSTTDSLPSTGYGTALQRLLNVRGTLRNPVYNITVVNLTLTQTEPTFLESYEAPSGGDWSIHRGGTVFVEGVDGFTIQQCLFDSPGGNGLFLSNYVRNAIIERNEFRYPGDSAIASLGSTELIDGTSGNQPRGTKIINNLMHENGIYGKQSAAYFQSLTAQVEFDGNILFNGPRDGVNFNDNFGGGHVLKNNLGFNMVRETADCGPFNFFNRVPYITRLFDGTTPSLMLAMSYNSNNFLITNYHSVWPLDHDDGSCYWVDTNNFLVYGGFKNNYGHSKSTLNNTYIYPDASHHNRNEIFYVWPYCAVDVHVALDSAGWGDIWSNNRCIIGNRTVYDFENCDTERDSRDLVPYTASNVFYAPYKDLTVLCGGKNITLQEYQRMGFDIGSLVYDIVDSDIIQKWAQEQFGLY
jgi:hypothetical protein